MVCHFVQSNDWRFCYLNVAPCNCSWNPKNLYVKLTNTHMDMQLFVNPKDDVC